MAISMHSDPLINNVMNTWMPRFLGGGIAYYDILTALEQIRNWDDWGPVWMKMAEMHEDLAEKAWEQGRQITAVQGFQTASAYYHIAYFIYVRDVELHERGLRKMVECHERALPHMEPAVEKVKIPFEDTHILGLFSAPKGEGPFPVLIVLPGLDSTKETRHRARGTYLRRGIAVLSLEGPGQGEVSLRMKNRPDYEVSVTAAIDYLETRAEVDASRIGMFGSSMGGYYAPRAAAFEPRIMALASNCGEYEYAESFMLDSRPLVSQEAFIYYSGSNSKEEAYEYAKTFTLEGVLERITCPLLVVHGKMDPIVPWQHGKMIVDQASSEDKQFILFDEGIHTLSNIRYKGGPVITNWLSEKLGGTIE